MDFFWDEELAPRSPQQKPDSHERECRLATQSCRCVCVSIHPPAFSSMHPFVHQGFCLSVRLSIRICPSIHIYTYLIIFLPPDYRHNLSSSTLIESSLIYPSVQMYIYQLPFFLSSANCICVTLRSIAPDINSGLCAPEYCPCHYISTWFKVLRLQTKQTALKVLRLSRNPVLTILRRVKHLRGTAAPE